MTNTLHRFGDAQSFRDDYIVFAIASRGKNDENSVPKLRRFLEIAMQFKPVNLGDSRHGGAYRPSQSMSPLAHWNRDNEPDFQKVIEGLRHDGHGGRGVRQPRGGRAVHEGGSRGRSRPQHQHLDVGRRRRSRAAMPQAFTVTAPVIRSASKARPSTCRTATCWRCRRCAGMAWSAMSLAKKMIDWVKEGRRTPDAGFSRAEPVLLVRGLQSVARAPAAGRGAGADEVRRAARGFFFALAIGAVGLRRRGAAGAARTGRISARSRRARPEQLHLDRRQWRRAGGEQRADCDGRPHHLDRPRVRV